MTRLLAHLARCHVGVVAETASCTNPVGRCPTRDGGGGHDVWLGRAADAAT